MPRCLRWCGAASPASCMRIVQFRPSSIPRMSATGSPNGSRCFTVPAVSEQSRGTILRIEEGQHVATLCGLEDIATCTEDASAICSTYIAGRAAAHPRYDAAAAQAFSRCRLRDFQVDSSHSSSNAPALDSSATNGCSQDISCHHSCGDGYSDDEYDDGEACNAEVHVDSGTEDTEQFSEVGEPNGTEVVFVKEGVAVWPTRRERIMGRLSLVKQHYVMFLAWLPYSHGVLMEDGSFQVMPYRDRGDNNGKDRTLYAVHPIPLSDIKALRKHTPTLGWHYIIVVLSNGITLPPLYFHNGGIRALIGVLKQHAALVKSVGDPHTYLVNDTADPLQRSLTSLDLADVLMGAPPLGSSLTFAPTQNPGPWPLTEQQQQQQQHPAGQLPDPGWRMLSSTIGDGLTRLVQGVRDSTTMWWGAADSSLLPFSMSEGAAVMPPSALPSAAAAAAAAAAGAGAAGADGNFHAAGTVALSGCNMPASSGPAGGSAGVAVKAPGKGGCQGHKPQPVCANGHASNATTGAEEEDFAYVDRRCSTGYEASTSLGDFELVDGCMDELVSAGPRRRVRPPPLSQEEWQAMFDAEGRLVAFQSFRERVFESGLEPCVRRDAWKFLLGLYPAGSTAAERAELMRCKRVEYDVLRQQWLSITPSQANRFAKWRERKSRVDKDVRRTDRAWPFYAAERGPNIKALRRILLTYVMWNFDLGYCQGMSDLASPLLLVMRDEADAFWCFAALMERLQGNFDSDQQAMHGQLLALRKLLQLLDPQLHCLFERKDALNYFFCFRWLLIHFKREFRCDDVLWLWEALWACPSTHHLHLYLCAAVLIHHRRAILEQDLDFDGMLKFCCDLSGRLELEPLLRLAEALVSYAGQAGAECLADMPVVQVPCL